MTRPAPSLRRAALVAAAALGVAGLAGCSSGGTASRTVAALSAPSIPTPLATSVDTPAGAWVTLPMGRLDETLNTFWQLFFRPVGTGSWTNHVEATATATNGGLVLASSPGGTLVVGVRPSSYLTYTPVISTSDGGASWTDGLVDAELAERPAALAATTGARTLALVASRVLSSAGGLSTWTTLTSEKALAASPAGRACDVTALTAVGYLGSEPLVGASCARPGAVGLLAHDGRGWKTAGIVLPGALARSRVEVLALYDTSHRTAVLLAASGSDGTSLVAAWSGDGDRWTLSAPLRIGAGETVASIGPAPSGGLFALLGSASRTDVLAVARPSTKGRSSGATASQWSELPAPPAGTATVAFGSSSAVDAFVASGTVLTVWKLASASGRWVAGQVVHVPIQYGSSAG